MNQESPLVIEEVESSLKTKFTNYENSPRGM
jgi:hypothetical protein